MNDTTSAYSGCIVSLTAVTWDFPLVGRTRMLTEAWRSQCIHSVFVEPPHSYRSLLRKLILREHRPLNVVRPLPVRYPVRWWPKLDSRRRRRMMLDRAHGLRRQLEKYCRLEESAAIVISPMWADWLSALPFARVVYDCIDDLSVHAPNSEFRRLYEQWEADLLARCTAAITTAESLKRQLRSKRPDLPIEVIRNGVDPERFRSLAENKRRPHDLPMSANHDSRPLIGFVGALFEWIDWELIRHAATSLPNYQFVFVGPNNHPGEVESLSSLENVAFLGPREYEEVPAYVAAFDVCWVPFKAGDIAFAANPVKMYEYLALGKPVITTKVADTDSFGDLVKVGTTPDEIITALQSESRPAARSADIVAARIRFAEANSWQVRARRFIEFLSSIPARD
ncbi:MAG: glycosyltransferase [Phycisphaerae bacterium]|nr:glycosyltransferase [Phycisphaerae bacterium]